MQGVACGWPQGDGVVAGFERVSAGVHQGRLMKVNERQGIDYTRTLLEAQGAIWLSTDSRLAPGVVAKIGLAEGDLVSL